jgi:hypothetical protein
LDDEFECVTVGIFLTSAFLFPSSSSSIYVCTSSMSRVKYSMGPKIVVVLTKLKSCGLNYVPLGEYGDQFFF